MASIFEKRDALETAKREFQAEEQRKAYERHAQSTAAEKAARDSYFLKKLAEPKDVTMALSRSTAELMVNALIDYIDDRRRTCPPDAVTYYTQILLNLRKEHESLFPVYDTSD